MLFRSLWAAWRFKLNAGSHAVLVLEVERLRAGATAPSSPLSGEIVEDLTGWRYEHLWGRGAPKTP